MDAPAWPLVCWEDLTTGSFQAEMFNLVPVAAISLGEIRLATVGGRTWLLLGGKLRRGMSGGPVFPPMVSGVVGIVSGMPPIDLRAFVDAWSTSYREEAGLSSELADDVEAMVLAHLNAGIGVAVPASTVIRVLETT